MCKKKLISLTLCLSQLNKRRFLTEQFNCAELKNVNEWQLGDDSPDLF
jgi:hypothetical protein